MVSLVIASVFVQYERINSTYSIVIFLIMSQISKGIQMPNRTISVDKLMESSGVKFGTSGVRGLAVAMTDEVWYAYTLA